jgi:hypothetical protein
MEEAPENGKESLHSAHASGINEYIEIVFSAKWGVIKVRSVFWCVCEIIDYEIHVVICRETMQPATKN